jgi:hypothetical protein
MDLIVNHYNGSKAAGAEAASNLQAELPVLGGLSDSDTQFILHSRQYLLSSPNIAGGSQADPDNMATPGYGGKVGIETDYPGYLAEGYIHGAGNKAHGLFGNVSEEVLCRLQGRNQTTFFGIKLRE